MRWKKLGLSNYERIGRSLNHAPRKVDPRTLAQSASKPDKLVAARSALMARKGLQSHQLLELLKSRRRRSSDLAFQVCKPRFALLILLFAFGLFLSITGSILQILSAVLVGYLISTVSTLISIALIEKIILINCEPITNYINPDEYSIDARQMSILCGYTRRDKELELIVNAWWRNPAPIRQRDLSIVVDYINFKQELLFKKSSLSLSQAYYQSSL